MSIINEKKRAELAKYLQLEENKIIIEDEDSNDKYNEYYCSDGVYVVMTEEESREAVKDDIENCLFDMGLDSFTPQFKETIIKNYIDDSWFSDVCMEDRQRYAEDIENESDDYYANRLIAECVDYRLIDTDDIDDSGNYIGNEDLQELLSEYMYKEVEENSDSFASWFDFVYGNDELTYAIKNHSIDYDIDGIADECIEADGYGHFISHWDGETIELDNFYAYKLDDGDYSKGR